MLKNYLENPFATKASNTQKLLIITGNHLKSLKAHNTTHEYNEMIEVLKPKYEALKKWHTKKTAEKSAKKAKPKSLKSVVEDFQMFAKRLHKQVHYFFKGRPEIIKEFFPNGKEEYDMLKKTNTEIIMTRLAETCAKYAADLDEHTDARAAQYLDDYKTARQSQLVNKDAERTKKEQAVKLKEDILFLLHNNLLHLLRLNLSEPNKVIAFFESKQI